MLECVNTPQMSKIHSIQCNHKVTELPQTQRPDLWLQSHLIYQWWQYRQKTCSWTRSLQSLKEYMSPSCQLQSWQELSHRLVMPDSNSLRKTTKPWLVDWVQGHNTYIYSLLLLGLIWHCALWQQNGHFSPFRDAELALTWLWAEDLSHFAQEVLMISDYCGIF